MSSFLLWHIWRIGVERKYIVTVTTTNSFLITVELEKNALEQMKSNRFNDIISVIKQQNKDVKFAIVTLMIYIIPLSIGIFLKYRKPVDLYRIIFLCHNIKSSK